jgi:hypothetical protein
MWDSNKKKGDLNMKTLVNKTILAVVATVLVAGTAFFTSCEKEENLFSQNVFEKSGIISIPRYSNYDEVVGIIDKVSTFDTLKELLDYEKTQGRRSIGAISDEFYENIDWDQFLEKDDLIDFYNNNIDMLDTIIDENGEILVLPKWDDTRVRYVANENGLFIIGENVYKIFKNCIIKTSENYLSELNMLSEAELDNLDTTIFSFAEKRYTSIDHHESCAYEWEYDNSITSEDGKISFYLCLRNVAVYYNYIGSDVETQIYFINKKKGWICWYKEKRTGSFSGNVVTHKKSGNTWEIKEHTFDVTKRAKSLVYPVYFEPLLSTPLNSYTYHFKSFNIMGRNLNVPYITLSHN